MGVIQFPESLACVFVNSTERKTAALEGNTYRRTCQHEIGCSLGHLEDEEGVWSGHCRAIQKTTVQASCYNFEEEEEDDYDEDDYDKEEGGKQEKGSMKKGNGNKQEEGKRLRIDEEEDTEEDGEKEEEE